MMVRRKGMEGRWTLGDVWTGVFMLSLERGYVNKTEGDEMGWMMMHHEYQSA